MEWKNKNKRTCTVAICTHASTHARILHHPDFFFAFSYHTLQELTVDHFIPNDTYIADGGRVALITGANCSGKSVYLKQVPTKIGRRGTMMPDRTPFG